MAMKVRFSRDEKVLLALMASINFTHIVDFMILMPLGPVLTRLFGLSVQEFGFLVSVYSLSAAASGILGMVFLDRFDRKQSLLFYYAGFAISTVACALAPTFAILLLARAFAGAFGGMLSSLVMAIISDAIAYNRRGTAMGVVMGSFSLASILGVPFSLLLANHFGWQAPFYFLGFASLLVWLLVFTWMQPMGAHLTGIRHSALDVVRRVSQNPPQLWALLFICTVLFGQFTVIPFISQSYVLNAGLPEEHLFYIYFFGGLCSIIGSPLAGRLADRYTKHKVFMVSALISIVPLYLITHLTPHPVWILITISSSFFS